MDFSVKNVQIIFGRNGQNGLAGVAARSRQQGVTTGMQCRDNRQSETAYNAWLMNKGAG